MFLIFVSPARFILEFHKETREQPTKEFDDETDDESEDENYTDGIYGPVDNLLNHEIINEDDNLEHVSQELKLVLHNLKRKLSIKKT